MNLIPIAEKLQADNVGVMSKTIFINMIPVECPTGILLRNKLQGTPIDYELPGFYKTKFQLIARAQGYVAGEALINQAIASLTVSTETTVGPMRVRYMRPSTLPVVFPLSKGNLLEFAVDIDLAFDV